MSLRSHTVYTVTIGGGSGAAVPLLGGAQPFTTQEDNNEDQFTPIRTQSGYLRIVDNGFAADGVTPFDWHDLIPATDTSRPVTLTHMENNTTIVDWQGFMQAQTFSGELYGNPQEREFPIQCVLTVTGGTDINYQQTAIQNFAYLLKTIIDSIPQSQRPTEFIIQGGTDAQTILLKEIDWQNFVTVDGEDGTPSARYPMYDVFDDMCKFWGWTARTKANKLYLTCADDQIEQKFLVLTYAQLETMAGGTTAGTTNTSFDTTTLSGNIFASVNNNEQIIRGYNKAQVKADGNAANGIAVDCFPDSFAEDFIKTGQIVETITDGERHISISNDKLSFDTTFAKGECVSGKASLNIVRITDEQGKDSDAEKDFRIKASYDGSVFASFESVYEHCYYDENIASAFNNNGGLSLNGNTYIKAHEYTRNPGAAYCTMKIRLGVGASRATAKWFYTVNNAPIGTPDYGWGENPAEFEVTLGDSGKFRVKVTSLASTVYYLEYIPTWYTYLKGKVFIDILGSSNLSTQEDSNAFDIHNFTVGFARNNYINEFTPSFDVDADLQTTHIYKSKNQNPVQMNYNADCIFASDNAMQFGYGIIINPDGTFMHGIDYGGLGLVYPEQHLADRVTSYWSKSRMMITGEFQTQLIADISPKYMVTLAGVKYHPIAISREWRDDVTQLVLLEMPEGYESSSELGNEVITESSI